MTSTASSGRGLGSHAVGSVLVFVSLAGAVCGISLLFLGSRAVMDIGGSCAEGGPYVSANPCPDGVPLAVFGGVWGWVIFTAIYAGQTLSRHIPGFLALAWPALFLSLGWNFLESGLNQPGPGQGVEYGFLVCAVLFALMGGVPLLLFLREIVANLLPFGHPPPSRPAPAGRAGAAMASVMPGVRRPRAASDGPVAPAYAHPSPPPPAAPPVSPLPALAALAARVAPVPYPPPPAGEPTAAFASPPPSPEDEPSPPPPPAAARDPRLDLHPTFPPGSPLAMADAAEAAAAAHTAYAGDTIVTALERLTALHRSGALTGEEFAIAKQRLLLGDED